MAFSRISQKILHYTNHNDWLPSEHPANACPSSAKGQYCRETQLPKLLPLWPHEIADRSLNGVARIVALLARALRAERQRGKAGHWTYDLSRHLALTNALREERAELKRLADRTQAADREISEACPSLEADKPRHPRRHRRC